MNYRGLRRQLRYAARDACLRTGLRPYHGLDWTAQRWEDSFRRHDTDSFAGLEETARYGVLAGYLSWLGGPHTVLDVGCGAGVLRSYLPVERLRRYLGIDPTAAAIEQASAHTDERTEFQQADPMSTELGEFDVVICNEVLYFAADPFALADRVGGFLRPGGHLLVSIWRHPGDTLLWRHLQSRYDLRDRVAVGNTANRFAPRGWVLGCLRR
jgi:2-polyprenyl-3-methyl-5-hydroxy-6-metoxy-1,4-benzoquinol methylase